MLSFIKKYFRPYEHWPLILVFLATIAFLLALANEANKWSELEKHYQGTSTPIFTLKANNQDLLGIASTSTFSLLGGYFLTKDQVRGGLRLSSNTNFELESVDGKWIITPDKPFKNDELIKITFTLGLGPNENSFETWQWAYQVKHPFAVIATEPINRSTNVELDQPIVIRFSHDIFYSAENSFRISPPTIGDFKHVGRNLVFLPKKPLNSNTIYKIELLKDLSLKNSKEGLADNFTFEFQTTPTKEELKNLIMQPRSSLNIFSPDAEPAIYFKNLVNKKSADIHIYKFNSIDQYIKSLGETQAPWWAKFPTRKTYDASQLEEVLSFEKDVSDNLINFPFKLPANYYLAELTAPNGEMLEQAWFQVSNLTAYSQVSPNKILLWVNTYQNSPVSRANLSLLGNDSLGETNDQGLFSFALPDTIRETAVNPDKRQELYVKITAAKDSLVLPLFDFESAYFTQDIAALNSSDIEWNLSKSNFTTADTIKLSATKISASDKLSARLINPNYINYFYSSVSIKDLDFVISSSSLASIEINYYALLPSIYELEIFNHDKLIGTKQITIESCEHRTPNEPATSFPLSGAQISGFTIATNISPAPNRFLFQEFNNDLSHYTLSSSSNYSMVLSSSSLLTSVIQSNNSYLIDQITVKNNHHDTLPLWSQTASNLIVANEVASAIELAREFNKLNQLSCNNYLEKVVQKRGTTSQITAYQLSDGGISLTSENLSNLELTTLIALTDPAPFDQYALKTYFINSHDDITATQEQSALSLAGLAFLNEPVLNRIASWLDYHRPTAKEKAYLVLAINRLGAVEWSKQLGRTISKTEKEEPLIQKLLSFLAK